MPTYNLNLELNKGNSLNIKSLINYLEFTSGTTLEKFEHDIRFNEEDCIICFSGFGPVILEINKGKLIISTFQNWTFIQVHIIYYLIENNLVIDRMKLPWYSKIKWADKKWWQKIPK